MSTRTLIERYHNAWTRGDFATARAVAQAQVHHRKPPGSQSSG